MAFLTSQTICIVMCSSPLVAFIFLSLLHNLMLTFEQVRKLNTPDIFQIKLSKNALIVMMNNMFIFTLSQCLKKISLSHYMVLVSSQGYTRIMVGSLWMITVCFTFLPTIFDPSMMARWKNEMVVRSSKYYKVSIVINVTYF